MTKKHFYPVRTYPFSVQIKRYNVTMTCYIVQIKKNMYNTEQ